MPGGAFYDQTVIDPTRGERWFCTEAEAVANGWRKSLREGMRYSVPRDFLAAQEKALQARVRELERALGKTTL